jgi:hypothetical protein
MGTQAFGGRGHAIQRLPDFVGVDPAFFGELRPAPRAIVAITEIRAFLDMYFDVLQNQDVALFDHVFHRNCVLYSQQDGMTVVRSLPEYRGIV